QVGNRLVKDVARVFRAAAAGRGVKRIYRLAVVSGDDPTRIVNRAGVMRRFARQGAVDLGAGRGKKIVTFSGNLTAALDRVGSRGDGLRLQSFQRRIRKFVGHHAAHVIFQANHVNARYAAVRVGKDFDLAAEWLFIEPHWRVLLVTGRED